MHLHQDILADYSDLELNELRQLRKSLNDQEAHLLVQLVDIQGQLAAATSELVTRYEAEPTLALAALT